MSTSKRPSDHTIVMWQQHPTTGEFRLNLPSGTRLVERGGTEPVPAIIVDGRIRGIGHGRTAAILRVEIDDDQNCYWLTTQGTAGSGSRRHHRHDRDDWSGVIDHAFAWLDRRYSVETD